MTTSTAEPTTMTQTPAATGPGATPPDSVLSQQDTDAAIAELRVEIDETDAALIAAVRRRIEISQQVGKLRMAAGGTRLSLAREQAIVAQYSAELGETGTSLAMLLLRAGRGRM